MSVQKDATCIGCGCTDSQACWDEFHGRPCHWLEVNRHTGRGVCSCCESHLEAFKAEQAPKPREKWGRP